MIVRNLFLPWSNNKCVNDFVAFLRLLDPPICGSAWSRKLVTICAHLLRHAGPVWLFIHKRAVYSSTLYIRFCTLQIHRRTGCAAFTSMKNIIRINSAHQGEPKGLELGHHGHARFRNFAPCASTLVLFSSLCILEGMVSPFFVLFFYF